MDHERTAYRFDMMPWKLVFCEFGLKKIRSGGMTFEHCAGLKDGAAIRIDSLPEAPEPGRVPKGADHLHIVTKGSGERDAREEEKWRALVFGTARCDHGHLPGDRCRGCRGCAPSMEGNRIGTTQSGHRIVIPSREDFRDIRNWVLKDD